MEKELADSVINQRSSRHIVTILLVRLQALKVCPDSTFKASNGWTYPFIKRHGLCICQRTKISQKLHSHLEDIVTSFHRSVQTEQCFFNWVKQATWMKPLCASIYQVTGLSVRKGPSPFRSRLLGMKKTISLWCWSAWQRAQVEAHGDFQEKRQLWKRETALWGACAMSSQGMDGWGWHPAVAEQTVGGQIRGATEEEVTICVRDQFWAHKTDKVKEKVKSLNTTQAVIPGSYFNAATFRCGAE